jgi:DNA-binding PadR family transcriptional regulator
MHGYRIKKIIGEHLEDFTQIKLPTIYYHLEKMQSKGLLSSSSEKPGSRPQKTVYSITDLGISTFSAMIDDLLEFDYKPSFSLDGVFYFSEFLKPGLIEESLKTYAEKLDCVIGYVKKHMDETMRLVPDEAKTTVMITFSHHIKHYQAELNWALESLEILSKGDIKND